MKVLIATILFFAGTHAYATSTSAAKEVANTLVQAADILSKEKIENGACSEEIEVQVSDIGRYVRDADDYLKAYDSSLKLQLTDAIKTVLNSSMTLQVATGKYSEQNPNLDGVMVYGPANGVYGPTSFYSFADKTLSFNELDTESDQPKWKTTQGTYSVTNATDISVELNIQINDKNLKFLLKRDWLYNQWTMLPADKSNANPYFEGFVEFTTDCDA